jgi:TetR/AcrR family transcriptional regulator, tetracycline repressor protein
MPARRSASAPRREPLSAERIVAAALVRIEADGLEKLSMRRLGSDLGVEAMSLYNYFKTKELMLDAVVGVLISGMELPILEGDWRARMRALSLSFRDIAVRNPRAFPLFVSRPLGAYVQGKVMAQLAISTLVQGGFEEAVAIRAFRTIARYVVGAAMADGASPTLASDAEHVDVDPAMASEAPLVSSAIQDIADTGSGGLFEFGLDLILDGLATHLS